MRVPGSPQRKVMERLANRLDAMPPLVLLLLCVGVLAGTVVADFLSGPNVSFALLYLLPIVVAAAFIDRRAALSISVVAVAVWTTIDVLVTGAVVSMGTIIWNSMTQLAVAVTLALALAELKAALKRERTYAHTDALTGLPNSRAFADLAEHELARARRAGSVLTVGYIDLDNFKQVNDRMGHAAGDELLKAVARLMRDGLRGSDIASRLGGDEFAILLPETDAEPARTVFDKLIAELADKSRTHGWPVTFSIGVTTFRHPPESVRVMLQRSDAMMYEAKHGGKNRVVSEIV